MKAITSALFGLLVAACLAFLPSCSFNGESALFPGVNLPVEIGVAYELEPDLFVIVEPADKGGIEVRIEGEGELADGVKKIPGGYEIESPFTGLIYRITEGASGKPRITIVGGTGKIKPVPPAEPVPDPEGVGIPIESTK